MRFELWTLKFGSFGPRPVQAAVTAGAAWIFLSTVVAGLDIAVLCADIAVSLLPLLDRNATLLFCLVTRCIQHVWRVSMHRHKFT
jgi:hypothetical protein